jgi:hypothetical protein
MALLSIVSRRFPGGEFSSNSSYCIRGNDAVRLIFEQDPVDDNVYHYHLVFFGDDLDESSVRSLEDLVGYHSTGGWFGRRECEGGEYFFYSESDFLQSGDLPPEDVEHYIHLRSLLEKYEGI